MSKSESVKVAERATSRGGRAPGAGAQVARRHFLAHVVAAFFLAPTALAQSGPSELDVPYVTSPENVVDGMLGLAQVKADDYVLDLGSGDGRIVIKAASVHGARGMGVEIDPRLVRVSNENAANAGVADRARFVEQDLFETDLTKASVITMYLLPDVNLKLRPSLLKLKPGTRIVSHDWTMGDWEPDAKVTLEVPDKPIGMEKKSTLMLWRVPASVEGTWTGARGFRANLSQKYQMLSGSVTFGGRTYPNASGRVDGDRVHLCFEKSDKGPCLTGGLGRIADGTFRLIVDGEGRQQASLILRRG